MPQYTGLQSYLIYGRFQVLSLDQKPFREIEMLFPSL
jgi:hypothetical protein